MTAARLLGLGTALPARAIGQAEAAEVVVERCCRDQREAGVLRRLYRRTTIERRGSVLLDGAGPDAAPADALRRFYPRPARAGADDAVTGDGSPTTARRMHAFREFAPPLALEASARALAEAGVEAGAVTHLLLVTCTGFAAPGVEVALIKGLGLPRSVVRIQVGFMGCHAALNALRLAATIAGREPGARVLVCSVELCSLHLQYGWDAQRLVPGALFADGAGAVVVGGEDAPPGPWRVRAGASRLIEASEDQMSWHIGDHGFEMRLSPHVPETVAANLRPWLDEWLAKSGLGVGDVGAWAIHAGGPRIVQAAADRLGLDAAAVAPSQAVLRRLGNMSSATVLFIIARLRADRAALPCVALGFGPGLTVEALLFGE